MNNPVRTICACIAAILTAALVWYVATGIDEQETNNATYRLTLDCNNAALMHAYGLPTKADVMEYHMHGQWGYYDKDTLKAFDELPGIDGRWDAFYGIEDNPDFDK